MNDNEPCLKKKRGKFKELPSKEEITKYLKYDESTGKLFWKRRDVLNFKSDGDAKAFNNRFADKEAGTHRDNGYVNIELNRVHYLAHRLVWVIHNGKDPIYQIDHINGRPDDNRIENLRLATPKQNNRNSKRNATNVTGVKGVSWNAERGQYYVSIRTDGKRKYIGRYNSLEVAKIAYREAADKYHLEFKNYGESDE